MAALIYLLVATHITILCVTLYLHRGITHRSLEFSPGLAHFMRFWLWLTTGMVTSEWVAVHRKHHQKTDLPEDPHSPHKFGIWQVLFRGVNLYKRAALDKTMVKTYSVGAPDDWLERNVYKNYNLVGILLLLLFNMTIFGFWGLVVWIVQMIWIPWWAAGVVNGLGHWWGYRNFDTADKSTNICPWGIVIGGEELHNNHHNAPASAKLSAKPWEFDVGWMWVQVLQRFGLLTVK